MLGLILGYVVRRLVIIKTHSSVSAAKKTKKDVRHTSQDTQ